MDSEILRSNHWKRLPWLLALLLTAGCLRTTRPVESPLALPPAFSTPGGRTPSADWWTSFNDAELDALIDEALAGNFSLRAAWQRLSQAEAIARRAGAERIPSIDASAGHVSAWRHTQLEDSAAGVDGTEYSNQRSLGLAARYELDLWGRIRAARDAARLDARASRADLLAAAISLSAQVATTWYALQEQRGQVALLNDQIRTTSDTLKLIGARFRQGGASATDVLQQQQLLESRRGERERTLADVAVFEHTLAVLLGRQPVGADFDADGTLIELPSLPGTGVPAEVVAGRPDVRSAYLSVQAADRRLAEAIADRYPRLSLTAGLETSHEDWKGLFHNWLATLAANLTAPLVDGGRRVADVDRTRAIERERLALFGQTLLDALAEVENALIRERQQRVLIDSLREQERLARLVLDQTRSQYFQGTVEYLRVLDAQQSLQSLQRDLLGRRGDLIGFRIALHRALAGGWEMSPPADEPVQVTPLVVRPRSTGEGAS
jgi:NodT family efflux transporter outer membrane factor (OMF) lipoprotein